MEAWQIAALIFGILGWSWIGVFLFLVVRVRTIEAELECWQAEFQEELNDYDEKNVPTSDEPLAFDGDDDI